MGAIGAIGGNVVQLVTIVTHWLSYAPMVIHYSIGDTIVQ
jgi:hypothetical protein